MQELRDQYDAVLITIGASTDKKLGLEGEDAEGGQGILRIPQDGRLHPVCTRNPSALIRSRWQVLRIF